MWRTFFRRHTKGNLVGSKETMLRNFKSTERKEEHRNGKCGDRHNVYKGHRLAQFEECVALDFRVVESRLTLCIEIP